MATPQTEREGFESNGCQSYMCKANKIRTAAKRVADAPLPNLKVGKMRLEAMKRFKKSAERLSAGNK